MVEYKIRGDRFEWLQDKVKKLARKSVRLKLDTPVSLTKLSEEVVNKGPKFRGGPDVLEVQFTVDLVLPELKVSGWDMLGRLDHSQDQTIVYAAKGKTIPVEFREADSRNCDHCRTRRFRKDTFVFKCEETGKHIQVGRSCLVDFMGHPSAEYYADLAQFKASIDDDIRDDEASNNIPNDDRHYNMQTMAAYIFHEIRKAGKFISRGAADAIGEDVCSTASDAMVNFGSRPPRHEIPSQEDRDMAQKAIAWAMTKWTKDGSDFSYNSFVLLRSSYLTFKQMGTFAAAIGLYWREVHTAPMESNATSQWVGSIGDKLEIEVKFLGHHNIESDWGTTILYKFEDKAGNNFGWFCSGQPLYIDKGDVLTIKGTVKKHSEFRNRKSTTLTRVKRV